MIVKGTCVLDRELLDILVCPLCKSTLVYEDNELHCQRDHLAFPVRDGLPIMLVDQARVLPATE